MSSQVPALRWASLTSLQLLPFAVGYFRRRMRSAISAIESELSERLAQLRANSRTVEANTLEFRVSADLQV